MLWLADVVALLVGLTCLFAAGSLWRDLRRRSARAAGEVVGREYVDGDRHDRVRFRTATGEEQDFVEEIRGIWKREVGSRVRVRYCPTRPEDASVIDPVNALRVPGLLVAGIVFAAAGILRLAMG